MVAPFAIEPKGTVMVRMLPIAKELVKREYSVDIVAPPWDNPKYSGKHLEIEGINLYNVEVGKDSILENIQITYRLIKKVKELKPDIIHVFKPKGHSGFAALYFCLQKSINGQGVKVIVDTDDWEGTGGHNERSKRSSLDRLVFHHQERVVLKNAQTVTVASRALQTQAWGFGIQPDKIFYIPNGQNPNRFDLNQVNNSKVRDELNLNDLPVIILYTRFFEFDLHRVVNIFKQTKAKINDVQFLVVGKGKDQEEIEFLKLITDSGLNNSTHMIGWVDFNELADYLATGDVAIYPFDDNLINRAKCSVKLTELMLLEQAIVADRVGQIGEYIEHNESGLLCEPEKIESFVQNIIKVLEDKNLRMKLGENARNRILQEFNWNTIVNNVEDAYNNV
jgi:glycosyltransferase involved in cell wall biosynthesis